VAIAEQELRPRPIGMIRGKDMKTIKFEDVLKECDEMVRQTEDFARAYKAGVDANICKILMERFPNADPNATMRDLVSESEMVEIIREAEAMTETYVKSVIEQKAREAYNRIVSAPEPPTTKSASFARYRYRLLFLLPPVIL
jgi:hypothetical protein